MDLDIRNKFFIIGGATSGFGLGTAKALLEDGAHILAVARNKEKLIELQSQYKSQIDFVAGDITEIKVVDEIIERIKNKEVHGALINAGGPPAMSFLETSLQDWDEAYKKLLRWKVYITQKLIPIFEKNNYGRIVYIESSSVKQPIENLALSNSLRLSVVGFVKTLSQEIASKGINLNILAPGSHETPAIVRLIQKKADLDSIPYEEAEKNWISAIKMGKLGDADDFGKLAVFLLSPVSSYITGQVYSVDGGALKGVF